MTGRLQLKGSGGISGISKKISFFIPDPWIRGSCVLVMGSAHLYKNISLQPCNPIQTLIRCPSARPSAPMSTSGNNAFPLRRRPRATAATHGKNVRLLFPTDRPTDPGGSLKQSSGGDGKRASCRKAGWVKRLFRPSWLFCPLTR